MRFPLTELACKAWTQNEAIKGESCAVLAVLGISLLLVAGGWTRRLVRISEEPELTGRGRGGRTDTLLITSNEKRWDQLFSCFMLLTCWVSPERWLLRR